jgi:hypothetical protein
MPEERLKEATVNTPAKEKLWAECPRICEAVTTRARTRNLMRIKKVPALETSDCHHSIAP